MNAFQCLRYWLIQHKAYSCIQCAFDKVEWQQERHYHAYYLVNGGMCIYRCDEQIHHQHNGSHAEHGGDKTNYCALETFVVLVYQRCCNGKCGASAKIHYRPEKSCVGQCYHLQQRFCQGYTQSSQWPENKSCHCDEHVFEFEGEEADFESENEQTQITKCGEHRQYRHFLDIHLFGRGSTRCFCTHSDSPR